MFLGIKCINQSERWPRYNQQNIRGSQRWYLEDKLAETKFKYKNRANQINRMSRINSFVYFGCFLSTEESKTGRIQILNSCIFYLTFKYCLTFNTNEAEEFHSKNNLFQFKRSKHGDSAAKTVKYTIVKYRLLKNTQSIIINISDGWSNWIFKKKSSFLKQIIWSISSDPHEAVSGLRVSPDEAAVEQRAGRFQQTFHPQSVVRLEPNVDEWSWNIWSSGWFHEGSELKPVNTSLAVSPRLCRRWGGRRRCPSAVPSSSPQTSGEQLDTPAAPSVWTELRQRRPTGCCPLQAGWEAPHPETDSMSIEMSATSDPTAADLQMTLWGKREFFLLICFTGWLYVQWCSSSARLQLHLTDRLNIHEDPRRPTDLFICSFPLLRWNRILYTLCIAVGRQDSTSESVTSLGNPRMGRGVRPRHRGHWMAFGSDDLTLMRARHSRQNVCLHWSILGQRKMLLNWLKQTEHSRSG